MYSCRFAQGTMQNQMSLWLRPHIKVSGFHDYISKFIQTNIIIKEIS